VQSGRIPGVKGETVLPRSAAYGEARQERNRRIDRFPRVIVYCENREDVSRCIRWARERGAPVRIRGGGHHYEGYSTGNGVLLIDVSRMSAVTVEGGLLRAEGGANNAAVYRALEPSGAAFPGGTCPAAGISGITQGGGWGLSCRLLGLTCDSLESVELVDACGRAMSANAHCNQELFWALRGGGGNFGVVTALTFRLPELKPEPVTTIDLVYPDADAQAQTDFWDTWQRWLPDADVRVTLQASICHAAGKGFAVCGRGLFHGEPEEAKASVAPLAALPGCKASYTRMTFFEAMQAIGSGNAPCEKFKSAGRFVTRPLSVEQIARIVDSLRAFPEGSVLTAYSLCALGGAVTRRNPGETAFYYRNAQYIAGIQSVWTQNECEEACVGWVQRNFPYLASLTAGSFISFPCSGLKDYMRSYYGGNAARLRRVKRLYDPCNVFCFPQSIR
jgi:hypothetical protein